MASLAERIRLCIDKRKSRGKDDSEGGKKSDRLAGMRFQARKLSSLASFGVIGAQGLFEMTEGGPGGRLSVGVSGLCLQSSGKGDISITEFVSHRSCRDFLEQQCECLICIGNSLFCISSREFNRRSSGQKAGQ